MNYTTLATQIESDFLAAYNMTVEVAQNIINRLKELNSPVSLIPTIEQLMTPTLDHDQECIVYLVRELDSADAKRKAQIKYQLKNYYHFDLSKYK